MWFLIPVSLVLKSLLGPRRLLRCVVWCAPFRTAISCDRASCSGASLSSSFYSSCGRVFHAFEFWEICSSCEAFPECLHFCSCLSFLTCLSASWSVGTPRLRHVRMDRPVYMPGGALLLSHSRASRMSGTVSSAAAHDCLS